MSKGSADNRTLDYQKRRDEHDRIFKKKVTYQESLDMATKNVGEWPNFMKVGLQTAPERKISCPDCSSESCSPFMPYGAIIGYTCNTCGARHEVRMDKEGIYRDTSYPLED